jgi:Protein of unknown function (DUF3793)
MGQLLFDFRRGTGDRNRILVNHPGADVLQKQWNPRRVVWRDIADRFCDPRDCLASYLALESAEVIAGVKPANLMSISNQAHPCGRNPYELWQRWGREIVGTTSLEVHELADRGSSVLILLYQPDALRRLLATSPVRAILRRAGYPEETDLPTLLDRLARRMDSGAFPHEIGIFLGYPLKDVVGFMGLASIPFTCQGPWKIYGDPRASLRLAETFRWCRSRMAEDLSTCSSPFECLEYSESGRAFFRHHSDNEYQLQALSAA